MKSYLYWPGCGKINHIFWLRSHKLKSFKSLLNLKSSLSSLPPLWCSILWSVVEGVYCLWFIAVEVSQRFLDHFDCDQMFLFVDASELENIKYIINFVICKPVMSVYYMQFSLTSNHILLDERLHYSPIVSIKIIWSNSRLNITKIYSLFYWTFLTAISCFVLFFCLSKYILELE